MIVSLWHDEDTVGKSELGTTAMNDGWPSIVKKRWEMERKEVSNMYVYENVDQDMNVNIYARMIM